MMLMTVFYLAFAPQADVGPDFYQADKLKHAFAFAVLAFLLTQGYARALSTVLFTLLGVGLFIETVQWFLPYRDASFWDLSADAIGTILGFWMWRKLFVAKI